MSDDRRTGAALNEGIDPTHSKSRWWVAVATAAVVLLVGAGSFLLAGRLGGTEEDAGPGGGEVPIDASEAAGSIEGRWVLESWEDGGDWIEVELDVNTTDEIWIEFTADFEGERDSFISADGSGTAGTFEGWTGCNKIRPATYEYSAGFLNHGEVVVQAALCEPNEAEQALLATLGNTSDGIEVIMGPNRMEWWGSNLEGQSYPLAFRRDGSPPPAPSEAPPPTTTNAPEEGQAVRVYEVDGIEVVTPSLLDELPDRAAKVEFHTMVIDSGKGPELCAGIVLESLPPQCSGPIAADLNMEGWSQEANGVRWGERAVVVTWPPVEGVVQVVAQSEYAPPALESPFGELPAECENIQLQAGAGPINDYARSLGDQNGDLYVTNGGTLVLQVVGDPAPHREALAELGGACVVEVARNAAEQRRIHDTVHPQLSDLAELAGNYSSSTGPGGRVEVQVPVADRALAQAIAKIVDDPTAIRIIGLGILHP